MTIQEFYTAVGGNYEDVKGRLITDERIKKFVFRFLGAEDFSLMMKGVEDKNWEQVFMYSHNLKGVGYNLGLNAMADAASDLCEMVRHGAPESPIDEPVGKVKAFYESTCAAIEELKASEG